MPKILEPRGRLAMALEATEKAEITRALAETGGHVGRAAEALGVSRRSLYTRIAALGVVAGRAAEDAGAKVCMPTTALS